MKKRKKASIFCILILFIIGALLLYTQTSSFRNNLKAGIEYYGSQAIHGNINIASINGNIFTGLEFHEIEVKDSINKPAIYLHYLKAEWNLKKLFYKTLLIEEIKIDSLNLYVSQEKDHSISIQKLIKVEEEVENSSDTSQSTLPINIDIPHFDIANFTVFLNFPDSLKIPKKIGINSQLSLRMEQDSNTIKLQNLNLKCQNPDFEILHFETDILLNPTHIYLSNLQLKTKESNLLAKAEIPLNAIINGKAHVSFKPLCLNDFQAFTDQKIHGSPKIELNIYNKNKEANFDIDIQENLQNISLSGKINSLKTDASYEAKIHSKQFNLGYWLVDTSLQTNINGQFTLKGQNLNLEQSCFQLTSKFKGSPMDAYPLDSISMHVKKYRDSIFINARLASLFGKMSLDAQATKLFEHTKYELSSNITDVNIGRIIQQENLQTNINAHIKLKGTGYDPDKMTSQLELNIEPSKINDLTIDKAEILGRLSQGNYLIDTLLLKSQAIDIEASGKGNINDKHSWIYNLQLKSLNSLSSFIELPNTNIRGQLKGSVSGKQDSLLLTSKLQMSDFHYDTLKIKELNADVQLALVDKILNGNSNIEAHDIRVGKDLKIDLFKSEQIINNNILNGIYKIQSGDSIELNTRLCIKAEEDLTIQMSQFSLKAFSQYWQNDNDTAQLILAADKMKFTNMNFSSNNQHIRLNGIYSFKGEEDLKLELSNIQLSHIPELNRLVPYPISGEINANLSLNGSAASPEIVSYLSIKKGQVGQLNLDSLFFKFNYKDEILQHKGVLIFNKDTLINTQAYLPIHFSLTDSIYLVEGEKGNYLKISTKDLDLSQFNEILKSNGLSVAGKLNTLIEAKIENKEINFKGKLKLDKGRLKAPKSGVDYKDIKLSFSLNKDKLNLDSLYIASGKKGYLLLKGNAMLPTKIEDMIHDMDIHIQASNFKALKTYNSQLTFNADSRLKGSLKEPIISGGLKLVQSKINIDPFVENTSVKNLDTPLLIAALEEEKNVRLNTNKSDQSTQVVDNSFFKRLRGEFSIDIPKNTWIVNSDMQLELSGLLRMIKTKDEPEFFGNISLVRGHIEVYGRKFIINKGDINLRGGSEINPDIDIILTYKFRDTNKESKSLELILNGTVEKPTYSFLLNNEYIEEKDAISYIIFGKKTDELGTSEQGQIASRGDQTKSLIYSKVSDMFQRLIAKNLGLDTIEINGEDNWETGVVTFGKYITNDLYISYSQLFSTDSENKQLVPYRLIIEYHIIRSLLLQASNEGSKSGFDLLWKIKL